LTDFLFVFYSIKSQKCFIRGLSQYDTPDVDEPVFTNRPVPVTTFTTSDSMLKVQLVICEQRIIAIKYEQLRRKMADYSVAIDIMIDVIKTKSTIYDLYMV
jgi:hypothetical protein